MPLCGGDEQMGMTAKDVEKYVEYIPLPSQWKMGRVGKDKNGEEFVRCEAPNEPPITLWLANMREENGRVCVVKSHFERQHAWSVRAGKGVVGQS